MNQAEALQQMIKAAGIPSVFIINSPNTSGATVVITPYAGETISGTAAGWQSLQLLAAAPTFQESESLAWRVFHAVVGKKLEGSDRKPIGAIIDIQEPFFLDLDEHGRYVHVFNIMVPAQWKESI